MFTDRGGRLDMELVYSRNEINSLRKAESSFRSTVLMDSNYQSTFSTFFDILSNHLLKKLPNAKQWESFEAAKLQRQANRSTVAELESTRAAQPKNFIFVSRWRANGSLESETDPRLASIVATRCRRLQTRFRP
jgi:hypothetical protein